MPLILLQPQPEVSEVAFMTFENGEEMNAGEKQHAGEMVALVV